MPTTDLVLELFINNLAVPKSDSLARLLLLKSFNELDAFEVWLKTHQYVGTLQISVYNFA